MDRMMVANGLRCVARKVMAADSSNPLDGMRRRKAVSIVSNLMARHTRGFFRDDFWKPVHAIWRELEKNGIPVVLQSAEYQHDGSGQMPTSKTWKFTVDFLNERGRPTTLHGVVVASGAGSVEDPLDRYDVVAYAT